jgi:hypothetical protein
MNPQRSKDFYGKRLIRENVRLAKTNGHALSPIAIQQLKVLTQGYGLSLALGDLLYLENGWYVAHAGLLRLATRKGCSGILVEQIAEASDPGAARWVFRATVFKSASSRGFVGYGDADPSNVSSQVRGAEMRVAETRAVNRALRKAYGIGLCSVEELGSRSEFPSSLKQPEPFVKQYPHKDSNNGQPRLRDRLCLLIRQYNLDPSLVKAYAADFCGTESLSGASRELVGSFISQLAKLAKENRESLVCKLNSYARTQEVTT